MPPALTRCEVSLRGGAVNKQQMSAPLLWLVVFHMFTFLISSLKFVLARWRPHVSSNVNCSPTSWIWGAEAPEAFGIMVMVWRGGSRAERKALC